MTNKTCELEIMLGRKLDQNRFLQDRQALFMLAMGTDLMTVFTRVYLNL